MLDNTPLHHKIKQILRHKQIVIVILCARTHMTILSHCIQRISVFYQKMWIEYPNLHQ